MKYDVRLPLASTAHSKHLHTQSYADLPLFVWRATNLQPSSRAGQFVVRRHRVHPAIADLIADLAGLGKEAH